MKELTLIIPVYNTPTKLLDRLFKSIDDDRVDIIIANDGSDEITTEHLERFAKGKSNVKLLNRDNQGAATARKNALDYLETKYFTFVDSDDVSYVGNLLELLDQMKKDDTKIGNGRIKCYLPNIPIGLNSKKWKLDYVDFGKDKSALGSVTCSFVDKIYHESLIPIIKTPSKHTQYHDMEVVYPALIQAGAMTHTNNIVYEYRMRNNSSSHSLSELDPVSSTCVSKILEAYDLMVDIMKDYGMFDEYKEEVESIMIKLIYQRMRRMIMSSDIENKKEMATLFLNMMESIVPGYQDNRYYKENFKGSEINDKISYDMCSKFIKKNGIYTTYHGEEPAYFFEEYDAKIMLKSKKNTAESQQIIM